MLQIKSIPAFDDNYIWLIQNRDRDCAVVDPGSAEPVLAYLKQHDLNLKAVLITHHHHDHIGGVAELVHQFPEIHVVGPAQEPSQLSLIRWKMATKSNCLMNALWFSVCRDTP